MKTLFHWGALGLAAVCLLVLGCRKDTSGKSGKELAVYRELSASRVQLPNGWSLTPVGASTELDDLPLNLVVSPGKKYLAVSNNGQSTQSITLIDAKNGRRTRYSACRKGLPRTRVQRRRKNALRIGRK